MNKKTVKNVNVSFKQDNEIDISIRNYLDTKMNKSVYIKELILKDMQAQGVVASNQVTQVKQEEVEKKSDLSENELNSILNYAK